MFDILKGLFSMAKQGPVKLILVLGIITSLGGLVMWYDHQRYQAGWNASQLAMAEANEQVVRDAVRLVEIDLQKVIAEEQSRRQQAVLDAERLLARKPEVTIREVVKIVENAECERTGVEYIGLLNKHIGPKPE